MSRLLSAALAAPWAIYPPALHTIMEIASRQAVSADALAAWKVAPRAIHSFDGAPLKGAVNVRVRDGVAIIPLIGPIFPRANMMTEMSGATSLDIFILDLRAALDSAEVESLVLDMDSPGGVVFGVSEAAGLIRSAAQVKPITAYVGGMSASAAYWLASAATEIVAEETALLGSIGVVMSASVQEQPDQSGNRYFDIVSAGAPDKRPDLSTEAGIETERAVLNSLEARFVGAVATYRGITPARVLADFGQGGLLIAGDAVRVGMADRVGSFEDVFAGRSGGSPTAPGGQRLATKGVSTMTNKTASDNPAAAPEISAAMISADHPAIAEHFRKAGFDAGVAEGRKAGAEDAQARVKAILGDGEAAGRESLARHFAFETALPAAAAVAALRATPKADPDRAAAGAYLTAAKGDEAAQHGGAVVALAPAAEGAGLDGLTGKALWTAQWESDPALSAEFSSLANYMAFMEADARGVVKILGKK